MAMIFDIRCARPASRWDAIPTPSRWDALRPRALPRGDALLALVSVQEEERNASRAHGRTLAGGEGGEEGEDDVGTSVMAVNDLPISGNAKAGWCG